MDKWKRDLYEKIWAAEDAVQECAAAVYGVDDKSLPYLVGSGTLLEVHGRYFLITAAHVLDENGRTNLYLPGIPLVEVVGAGVKTQAPLNNRKNDSIDLGIIEIDASAAKRVLGVRAITPSDIATDDVPKRLTSYGFVGCPSSKNKPRPGRKLQVTSNFLGVLPAKVERYAEIGAEPILHFAGEFDRSRVVDRKHEHVAAPDPEGMSGGGVWRVGSYAEIDSGRAEPKFIGVGIEHHKHEKLLLGVRVAFVIASLAAHVPELKPLLPEIPKTLRINVVRK